MENEEWRDIPDYEGIYQVSNFGNVRRLKSNNVMLKSRLIRSYPAVDLWKDNKGKHYYIHRLVAQAFIPNPENKPCVDHIDTDRMNNNVSNLRWCTYSENNFNPLTTKKQSMYWKGRNGILCKNSKPVICIELNKLFWGTTEAGRITKIAQTNISQVASGKPGHKTAGGYHWRYATPEEIAQAKQK